MQLKRAHRDFERTYHDLTTVHSIKAFLFYDSMVVLQTSQIASNPPRTRFQHLRPDLLADLQLCELAEPAVRRDHRAVPSILSCKMLLMWCTRIGGKYFGD